MLNTDLFIKGGVFSDSARLSGFLSRRMNIVYGRNGSGKSTIARAFREQMPSRQAVKPGREYSLSFDGSGSLPVDTCSRLFVFNEDFIDDNVKVKDSLRSIIRIGSSAELDAPIQEAKDKIKELQNQQKPIRARLDVLDGASSVSGSIAEADKALKDGLKRSGGYSDRLYRIDGKQKLVASVLTPVLDFDRNDSLPASIGELSNKLDSDIDRLLSLKSGNLVSWQEPSLSGLPDISIVNGLLSRTVRPAELSSLEKMILEELSTELASDDFISQTESIVIGSSRSFCPLCHQSISEEHKHTLAQRIVKFRDRSVTEFKELVEKSNNAISRPVVTLPSFPTRDYDSDLADAEAALKTLCAFIDNVKNVLNRKAQNPFSAIDGFDVRSWDLAVGNCKDTLKRIADDVAEYNQSLQEKDNLKREIDQLNIRLAYHENKAWIDAFNDRTASRENLNNDLLSLDGLIDGERRKIESLSAKIDQVEEAMDQINRYLEIIFAGKKLRLAPAGKDQYKLQIRQGDSYRDIPTRSISSGERNALALAYFFACVLENKEQNYNYSDRTLLVIDDPVSSFDADNRAGVLSLVSGQIKKVLRGNADSQVLVFTHDYATLRFLCEQRNGLFNVDSETDKYVIIRPNHRIKEDRCSHILENMDYGSDLMNIYNFAAFDDPEEFDALDSMGNTIRRFAESYASRMFRCQWNALFTDERRLECLPEDVRDNIKSFEIRSVLNSESHGVTAAYEPAEIQRAARTLLIYMFYASYEHLYAYLVGGNSANESRIEKIEDWVGEF